MLSDNIISQFDAVIRGIVLLFLIDSGKKIFALNKCHINELLIILVKLGFDFDSDSKNQTRILCTKS